MKLFQPLFSVLPRSRASVVLLLATLAMALVTTTLVAAVPMYSSAVIEAGLRATLAEAPVEDAGIEATFRAPAGSLGDRIDALQRTGEELPGEADTMLVVTSDSYTLGREGWITNLAALVPADVHQRLLRSVEGRRSSRSPAIDVSLHAEAAAAAGVSIGDVVTLERGGRGLEVEVVELVEPADVTDPLWFRSAELREGALVDGSFTVIGPMLVEPDELQRLEGSLSHRWRVIVDPDTIGSDQLDALRSSTGRLERVLGDRLDAGRIDITTNLTSLTAATDSAIAATTAVIAAVLLQLVGLALYGVGLAASVLVGSRTVETTMLRSRGATPGQLGAMAAVEGIAVAVPAAVLGPLLATQLVELLESWGPIAATGLDLRPEIRAAAVLASFVVALAVVVVVSYPAVRSARGFARSQSERARPERALFVQRGGLDIALAGVAAAGLWRLSGTAAASTDVSGRLGTDPVLVLAPTIGAVAAALLTLRLIGTLASALQRPAARRNLALSLAGWELARRPARTARVSVLVVLSVSVGTFAAVHGASWQRSMADQADADVTVDAVVTPDARPAATVGAHELPAAYSAIDGVTDVAPVHTEAVAFTADVDDVVLVASDTSRLSAMLELRDDMLPADLGPNLAALHRPDAATTTPLGPVDGDLTFAFALTVDGAVEGAIEVGATLVDGVGTLHRVHSTPIDVEVRSGSVSLPQTGADGRRLSGPTALLELELTAPSVQDLRTRDAVEAARFELELSAPKVGDRAITLPTRWTISESTLQQPLSNPQVTIAANRDRLSVEFVTGTTEQRKASATTRLGTSELGGSPSEPIPVLVNEGVLAATQLLVGDVATVRVGGASTDLRIAGVMRYVPFATDAPRAVLVDWATLSLDRWVRTRRLEQPARWALSVAGADRPAVADALAAPPLASIDVRDRRQEAQRLSRAPVTVGLSGSLAMALLASMAIAAAGLILTAVVGARERRPQFAVLRAVGVRASELRAWLLAETVPLVGFSAIAGAAAGVMLARLALVSLTTRGDGSRAVPAPHLVIPWATIGALVAITVAVGIVLPILTARLLHRHRTADDLRIGDTT